MRSSVPRYGRWRRSDDDAFSVDAFLYARCVIVANGRTLFDHVLRNPTTFPKDLEFESLLRLAPEAYRRATGQAFDHLTPVSYETFSNKTGWSDPT